MRGLLLDGVREGEELLESLQHSVELILLEVESQPPQVLLLGLGVLGILLVFLDYPNQFIITHKQVPEHIQ